MPLLCIIVHNPCYGLNVCGPLNPYIKILTPNVMALGGGVLEVFRLRRWSPHKWDYKRDPTGAPGWLSLLGVCLQLRS